jgi:hypothetical protein
MGHAYIAAEQVIPGDVIVVTGYPAAVTEVVTDGDRIRIYTKGDDGDYVLVRPSWELAATRLAPRTSAPVVSQPSDREHVEQAAAELGMDPHPAPCRVPASPDCTCP